ENWYFQTIRTGITLMSAEPVNLLTLLAETRFAETIADCHMQRLCEVSRLHRLNAGAVLFREGEIEDDVFVISSGHIQLSMKVPRRGDVAFLTTGPGELVGWSGLVSDGRMTATATALDDTTLIAMSGQKLQQLCSSEHNLGYVLFQRVAQVLSKRLLSTRLQLLDLFAEGPE
ncbi:MAG: Crp/Fnr family transcriptional regulator, partial [Planctomycetaceae bacterium]|nr:Crp/Fnr family transcriptional regulator [Planctomycetaceae bacterium]